MENGVEAKRVKMDDGSLFGHLDIYPPDPIFHVKDAYLADKSPNKVNLGIGAYRTEDGQPWVLPVVRTIEAQMSADLTLNHEYLPLSGMKAFCDASTKLLLGESSPAISQNRACGVQAISGTGSIRLGFEFLQRHHSVKTVYISKPTWGNHRAILTDAGYTDIREYQYFKKETRGLDYEGMMKDLKNAPEGSIFILHACAHNPTGVDPNKEQWKGIMGVMKDRQLVPFFDSAYQGFASGDPDADAWPVREFVREGFELFAAQSYSKNFGLYNERVGQLCCVLKNPEAASAVKSQLVPICRRMWSNPPNHGARIVATALNNPSLFQEWLDNLSTMSDRIRAMRKELYQALKANGTPGTWEHIINQIGMFSFTGLTPTQVEYMTSKYHIYLMKSGRINMCGLNAGNLEYVASAIKDAVVSNPEN